MMDVLEFLAREDAGQPDPSTLGPEDGRALAVRNSLRWNRELPAVESTDEMSFPRIVPELDGSVPEHAIETLLITPPEAEPGLIRISVFRQLDTLHEQFPVTNGPVAVSGDSAGANLALALILHEQEEDRTAPDVGLMFYGVFGADFETT